MALMFFHRILFLEQVLILYFNFHSRWLNLLRLRLTVISEYNNSICKVVLSPVFCKALVLHRCDNVNMWWNNIMLIWYAYLRVAFFKNKMTKILCINWVDTKVSPVHHFTSAVTMKAFLAVVVLAALGLAVSFVSSSYIKIICGSHFISFLNRCMSSYYSMPH